VFVEQISRFLFKHFFESGSHYPPLFYPQSANLANKTKSPARWPGHFRLNLDSSIVALSSCRKQERRAMEELPLPGLLPGDPQNRLSTQGRRRVARAHAECNRIQWEAVATARARHLSDEKTRYLVNQADLKGARTVLKVLAAEYVDAGLNLKEFWGAMRDDIDSAANSLSLYDAQRRLLEAEFLVPPPQRKASIPPRSAAPSVASKAADSVGAQINRLREECHLTSEELAEKINLEVRSVQRHLAGNSVPYARHLRAYERVFSKLLNRQVLIRKLS
jgi:hypothetical protein